MYFRVRAAAIILNKNNELLLVHHRHPQTGEEWWTLPGGGLEGVESATDAIIREVKEGGRFICTYLLHVFSRVVFDNAIALKKEKYSFSAAILLLMVDAF